MSIGIGWGGKTFSSADEGVNAFSRAFADAWSTSPRVLGNVVRKYLKQVMDEVAKTHSGAYPGGTTSNSLSRRSGETVTALTRRVQVTGTTWEQMKGAVRLPGALAIHEFGGTINSRGKMLTIPLPAALNSNGMPIYPRARDWANTFTAMTRNGNLLIFQRRGREIVPLYVLKDTVRIPPRLGVRKALVEGIPYFTSQAVDRVVAEVTKQMKV
jgi:hypothetical protein